LLLIFSFQDLVLFSNTSRFFLIFKSILTERSRRAARVRCCRWALHPLRLDPGNATALKFHIRISTISEEFPAYQ